MIADDSSNSCPFKSCYSGGQLTRSSQSSNCTVYSLGRRVHPDSNSSRIYCTLKTQRTFLCFIFFSPFNQPWIRSLVCTSILAMISMNYLPCASDANACRSPWSKFLLVATCGSFIILPNSYCPFSNGSWLSGFAIIATMRSMTKVTLAGVRLPNQHTNPNACPPSMQPQRPFTPTLTIGRIMFARASIPPSQRSQQ